MKDITAILSALMALMTAALTTLLIPWLRERTGGERFESLCRWVKIAVAAAEQLYVGRGRGAEKKCYVLELLEDLGMTYDEEALDALIEAEVLRLGEAL